MMHYQHSTTQMTRQRRRFYSKKGTVSSLWASSSSPSPNSNSDTTEAKSTNTSEEFLASSSVKNNSNNQEQVAFLEEEIITLMDDNGRSTVTLSLSQEQQQQPNTLPNSSDNNNDSHDTNFLSSLWKELPPSSILWLNAVAVIWGTQHPVIKMVVEDSDVAAFSLARFGLGAIIASPYTPGLSKLWKQKSDNHENDTQTTTTTTEEDSSNGNRSSTHSFIHAQEDEQIRIAWRWGIEMGLWMFLGYAFQAIGLAFTTAQRSGFLLYLNVKFVPFFARVLLGRQISIPTWISAFAALVGTALLAGGDGSVSPNVGDAWSIAAAAMSAMFILRLESASKAVTDSAQLNAACLWVVATLAFVWSIVVGGTITSTTAATTDVAILAAVDTARGMTTITTTSAGLPTIVSASWEQTVTNLAHVCTNHLWELVYLGGVTTALANYMQTRAQRNVTAERASVIYAMDPVYGAFFANLLLGEQLEGWAIVGAALITVTAATNAFLDLSTTTTTGSNGNNIKNSGSTSGNDDLPPITSSKEN